MAVHLRAALLVMLGAVSGLAEAQVVRTRVLFPGDPIPGLEPWEFLRGVYPVDLNDRGEALFYATIEGDLFRRNAVVHVDARGPALLARQSFPPAGNPLEVVWSTVYNADRPKYTPSGVPVLPMLVSQPFTQGTYDSITRQPAMFLGGPGPLTPIARTGDPAPDVPDATLRLMSTASSPSSNISFDRAGRAAFLAELLGPSITQANNTGIWRGEIGNLRLIAREGSTLPGLPNERVRLLTQLPLMDEHGTLVFHAAVTTPAGNRDALYAASPGATTVRNIVTSREPSGLGPGILFGVPELVAQTSRGVVFMSVLTGGGVTAANDHTTWIWRDGVRELLVREGDPAPYAGERHIGPSRDASADDYGGVLLRLNFTGPIPNGLWYWLDGRFEPVLIPGITDAGMGGPRFAEIYNQHLGGSGDLFVHARLADRYPFEEDGYWIGRRFSTGWKFTPLLMDGQLLELSPIDRRYIWYVNGAIGPNRRGESLVHIVDRAGVAGTIMVRPDWCLADFNGDEFADFFDYADFTAAFESGSPLADINRDLFIDYADYADFITAFESGC